MSSETPLRLLISGGPGSGCTATASALSARFGIPHFDSDAYYHKPTNPPFQEQYTPDERRLLIGSHLGSHTSWILSGSIATWQVDTPAPTHGIFLSVPRHTRLHRLLGRQRSKFGSRIDPGGDMEDEHRRFMAWAAGYEDDAGAGRNLRNDRAFLTHQCARWMEIVEDQPLDEVVCRILAFMDTSQPH